MKSVTIQGTKYAVGYVLAAYIEEEDDLPVFGVIKDILIKQNLNDTLFILQPYRTHTFNAHYYSYEVYPVSETLIYKYKELADHHPLCISFSLSSPSFVRTKYDICLYITFITINLLLLLIYYIKLKSRLPACLSAFCCWVDICSLYASTFIQGNVIWGVFYTLE